MPERMDVNRRDDRRRLLELGSLGMLGLSLDRLLGGRAAAAGLPAEPSFGRASRAV